MSDCPSRYLTADGRVLRCDLEHGDAPEAHGTGADTRGRRLLMWRVDAPCAWDATCKTCKPRGYLGIRGWSDVDGDWHIGCPTCEGIGVDETIPLHMIGIGSRLSREDRTDLIIVGKMDDIAFCVEPDGHGHQLIELADIGRVWTVARAVPPAHTTTN
jgi:hypothetical protein